MPLPLTVSCLSKVQIGLTFLVPAHPGSPRGKEPLNGCVRACVRVCPVGIASASALWIGFRTTQDCRRQKNLKSEHVNGNRPIHTATPDTTQTGLSCRVWCDGVNRVGPTARQVRSVSGLRLSRVAQCDRRTHSDAERTCLNWLNSLDSIHTAWYDPDRTVLSCLAGAVNWA